MKGYKIAFACRLILIVVLCILGIHAGFYTIGMASDAQGNHSVKHEIAVNRMLIPFFAYDRGGNPIYDLKKDDIRLYINRKRVKIRAMNQIQLGDGTQTTINNKYGKHDKNQNKNAGENNDENNKKSNLIKERVNFIIIDTMYNSFYGLKNSKKIGKQLIDSAIGGEFAVMENSSFGGLKLLGEPGRNKAQQKKYLKRISQIPERNPIEDGNDITLRNPATHSVFTRTDKRIREDERNQEKLRIKTFCACLANLKYTLQSIKKPKTVFLISEGFPEVLLFEVSPIIGNLNYDDGPIEDMRRLVKEINEGGSSIYVIYPGRKKVFKRTYDFTRSRLAQWRGQSNAYGYGAATLDDLNLPFVRNSGISTLRTMALGSGGRLFQGDIDKMVSDVSRTTSAYYELAVDPLPKYNKNMRIRIKARRKGIKIHSFLQTAADLSYSRMDPLQKKVLAIHLMLGRTWAHILSKVERAAFEWQAQTPEKEIIEVEIPEHMRGQNVDIFLIQFEDGFKKPDVLMQSRPVKQIETIEIMKLHNKKTLCFLIIEPGTTHCIYNIFNI